VTHFLATGLDITERKRAEEALRESEERFRKLAETTTAAAFIFEGGRIRYANSAASDITGYSSEELLAKSFWEIARPDINADTRERLQARAIGEPVPPRAEVRIMTKGGEARWLDFNAGFVELDGRQYVLGTAFDITARKLAEEALRQSEEKFRTLVDTTPAATVIFQGTRVRYVNRMVFDVLGYSAEDIPGLNFWDAVHPDYRDLVRERGNARLRGEDVPSSYEVRFLTKSGEPRWGLYSAAVITYEGTPAVIGTVYDITERKEAEEALQVSEERYRMLYQDNPSMYFTLCEGLTVLAVNKYGAGQLGYEPEDLIGEPVLEVVHPGDRNSVRRQLIRY
jgi:PAS domain S-box-containing protein